MMRITGEGVALFLLPFGLYAAYLVLGPRLGFAPRGGATSPTTLLALCGVGLIVAALVVFGVFGERAKGNYVPAHLDHGRLVPGRMQ